MQRIPEPELMDEAEQARAYALADFAEPNERFVACFEATFPEPRRQRADLQARATSCCVLRVATGLVARPRWLRRCCGRQ
jgi:hypothetical protein